MSDVTINVRTPDGYWHHTQATRYSVDDGALTLTRELGGSYVTNSQLVGMYARGEWCEMRSTAERSVDVRVSKHRPHGPGVIDDREQDY